MIVCIAEKPSVAKEIADVLGARTRREGYLEGNGYQVTWTFGHLCTLKEPHEYTPAWKSWSLGSLPMIPPRFGIKLIADSGIEKQFKVIQTLMEKADLIINCGDAGQEGELIQRWVYQKAGCKVPVKRLWISSLTEDAIREGFANLKDQSHYQHLYEAGMTKVEGSDNLYVTNYQTSLETTMSYGPYKMTGLIEKSSMTFERNENWFGYTDGKHIYTDPSDGKTYPMYQTTAINCQVVAEADTRKLMFLQGKLMGYGLQSDDYAEYRDSDRCYATPSETIFFFIFSSREPTNTIRPTKYAG